MSSEEMQAQLPVHYSGKFQGSYAYLTIKDRLPVILVKVVDTLCQEKNTIGIKYGEDVKEELKEIIGKLSGLQNEMVTNKPIKYLVSDGPDVDTWNAYFDLQTSLYGITPAWFESSWLYVECYLYRRIKEAFELSNTLKEYDPFLKQKEESFLSSMSAVQCLLCSLDQTVQELGSTQNKKDAFNFFKKYLELSLWGNKCDLSLSAGKENIMQLNALPLIEDRREKIIVNDTDSFWQIIQDANNASKEVQIDFVLDNAGFELLCDLCFLHVLQAAKLVKKIRLYVKRMPWFVSDALEEDIDWLLESFSQSENGLLNKYSKEWSAKLAAGDWTIEKETFWTLPHDYSEMQSSDTQLYNKLAQSSAVIFKGDLNYRKLTGDRQWEENTTFLTALNGFLPTSVVSLRTIKADVIVGLKPGTTETMNKISANWKFSGDFAVIQCARAKS